MLATLIRNSRDPRVMPFVLLFAAGTAIALMLPMAKFAIQAGFDPLAYAFWQAAGGGVVLLVAQVLQLRSLPAWHGWYFLWSGLTALALPNAIAFVITLELGAAVTSVFYALPSLVTYVLALLLNMERFSLVRATGLLVAIFGCIWILLPGMDGGLDSGRVQSILLGLLIPVSLGIGNIYRTRAWPTGASPIGLAAGMLLAGAAIIGLYLVLQGKGSALFDGDASVWLVVLLQAVLTAQSYLWFFRLQKLSSPTFLSQLGFIIIPVGMLSGNLVFDEPLPASLLLGVLILFLGMFLANRRQGVVPVSSVENA